MVALFPHVLLSATALRFVQRLSERSRHLYGSHPAMKVYTKTGDAGETSLFNGARVPKHDARVEAYGTVDECNAAVGLACAHLATVAQPDKSDKLLLRLAAVQNRLFDLGAHLATPRDSSSQCKLDKTAFSASAADDLEAWIDDMEAGLSPLVTFVLPGGHPSAAALHLARTIARRAERAVTPMLIEEGEQIDPAAYRFLNRLSDFFFVASRHANMINNCPDVAWTKQQDSSNLM
jgi:cob(I)alamin adenosyltransferase